MPFTIPAPGKYIFSFTNSQTVACQTCFNFFYGVSIIAPAAKITKWPLDIHPNSTVSVEGLNFGPKGKIELRLLAAGTDKFCRRRQQRIGFGSQ